MGRQMSVLLILLLTQVVPNLVRVDAGVGEVADTALHRRVDFIGKVTTVLQTFDEAPCGPLLAARSQRPPTALN